MASEIVLDGLGPLPEGWTAPVFATLLAGGTRNGVYKPKKFHGRGCKIVNMGELFGYPRLRSIPMKRVELSESEQSRFLLQPGDLLFARRSLVAEGAGKCTLVLEADEATAFESSIIRARPDRSKADSEYLYYVFSSPYGRYALGTILRQVAVSGITGKDLVSLNLPLPTLAEQRRIAAVLGALDDKIELNRKMNQTLEEMAQAIFKSWFIDFDGHDDLVESELGMIPMGWSVGAISDLVTLKTDSVKPYDSPDTVWEHFSIPAFDDGNWPVDDEGSTIKSGKYRVPAEAVLVSKLNPRFPRIWMTDSSRPTDAICSTEFMPFVASGPTDRGFAFCLFRSRPVHDEMLARVTGSTGSRQRVKPREVAAIPTVVPSAEALARFGEIAEPIHKRRLSSIRESRTLAEIRDTLLPKLISGEVRVPEAEGLVEAAV
jgi:type I restriction enzyme, S subunit